MGYRSVVSNPELEISRTLATLRWSRSRVGSPASTLTGSSSLLTWEAS